MKIVFYKGHKSLINSSKKDKILAVKKRKK